MKKENIEDGISGILNKNLIINNIITIFIVEKVKNCEKLSKFESVCNIENVLKNIEAESLKRNMELAKSFGVREDIIKLISGLIESESMRSLRNNCKFYKTVKGI